MDEYTSDEKCMKCGATLLHSIRCGECHDAAEAVEIARLRASVADLTRERDEALEMRQKFEGRLVMANATVERRTAARDDALARADAAEKALAERCREVAEGRVLTCAACDGVFFEREKRQRAAEHALAESQAREAALREAYERDERMPCDEPGCDGGYVLVGYGHGHGDETERCERCDGRGHVRILLADPSPRATTLLAAVEACDAMLAKEAVMARAALARYEAARAAESPARPAGRESPADGSREATAPTGARRGEPDADAARAAERKGGGT